MSMKFTKQTNTLHKESLDRASDKDKQACKICADYVIKHTL